MTSEIVMTSEMVGTPKIFVHPSTWLVSGPTGSGKTYFIVSVLRNRMIQPQPTRILWCYGEWQQLFQELQVVMKEIEFIEGLPTGLTNSIKPGEHTLIIIDDLMSEVGDSEELKRLYTRGSHHRSLTIIYVVQNLFDKGKSHRTVSLNTHYMVLFKNPRDKSQIDILGRQMYPSHSRFLTTAFADATRDAYGYLVLDLRPETHEDIRVVTKIMPGEDMVVYLPSEYKRK